MYRQLGRCISRYRVWHPRIMSQSSIPVAMQTARLASDVVIHLAGMLSASPDCLVDVRTLMTKLASEHEGLV